ncbi:MAG TPA: hypothetical protein VGH28_25015 [Polyangiaceae bacterium]
MSARVRAEWRARVAAEYASATVTQSYVLWMMQAGAPPDLIDDGLAIVQDELVHSRMSHDVLVALGDPEAPRASSRSSATCSSPTFEHFVSARPLPYRSSNIFASGAPSQARRGRSIASCATRSAIAISVGTCSIG